MTKNLVDIRRDGPVVTVLINRPERMNALNREAWRQLGSIFADAINPDMEIRCVVVKGEGGRAFAAGADIAEFAEARADAAQAARYDTIMRDGLAMVAACPHPVIAQIVGPCVGGGLELAALCDLRISGRSGRFGVPVGKIAVTMTLPELAQVQRLIGSAAMMEILLEARVFDAAEALDKGLVHRVVEDEALEEEVAATVRRITANAPLVNRRHKALVRLADSRGAGPFSEAEQALAYDCLATADHAEGMAAFAAKRPPRFTGQ